MTNILTRNKQSHDFARVPKINIPRSVFPMGHTRMQTMDAGKLIPIMAEEVLPGDTWIYDMEHFGRLATQITANLDNAYIKTWFFYCPYRITWKNFPKQHGERENPDDTIDYITPKINSGEGFEVGSLFDYLEMPTGVANVNVSALMPRAYNRIINDYFRDENLEDKLPENTGDSDDNASDYTLFTKSKASDYFTRCLPTLLKGGDSLSLPLGISAPVVGNGMAIGLNEGTNNLGLGTITSGLYAAKGNYGADVGDTTDGATYENNKVVGLSTDPEKSGLKADLTKAVATSLDALRNIIMTEELLERDNRNGTRYFEILEGRYGCTNPDMTLQRSVYLGGTSQLISINPVLQTSSSTTIGEDIPSPQGNIAGYGVVADGGNVIKQSFGEFGCIIGLACITTIPSYQQGLPKKHTRFQRYDYYYPEFNNLSDQAVLNKEIYCQGESVLDEDTGEIVDDEVFGYQERYSEYKYQNNSICGKLKSTATTSLEAWHFAEKFDSLPTLSEEFIKDPSDTTMRRAVAVQNEPLYIGKFDFKGIIYRGMPVYNIPKTSSFL